VQKEGILSASALFTARLVDKNQTLKVARLRSTSFKGDDDVESTQELCRYDLSHSHAIVLCCLSDVFRKATEVLALRRRKDARAVIGLLYTGSGDY
jgi:hypothetical protein